MYSATPFPIWDENPDSIWNKLYIINVNDMYGLIKSEKYFGVKDCIFTPCHILEDDINYEDTEVSNRIVWLSESNNKVPTWLGKRTYFDLGNEIKYLAIVKKYLPQFELNEDSFSYNFIPSYKRKITQYRIMELILETYPTSNVIIMNGNDTGMTLWTNNRKKVDSDSKITEPSKQVMDLLNRPQYDPETGNKIYLFKNKPTFIVGFQTCNMSVTLIDEDIGNFDNMLFYHDHLRNDPECLYQMMRIVFSYQTWSEFNSFKMKTTRLWGNQETYQIIRHYEDAVEKIEVLESGKYVEDEIRGNVPIKEKKKKLKEDNELQQIPEDLIDVEIEKITINPKNEGKKWKYIEETYQDFYGKGLKGRSDPRRDSNKKDGFMLTSVIGKKHTKGPLSLEKLNSHIDGLSWFSNFAIGTNKYKYIRLYVGYKNITDNSKYTVIIRKLELENKPIVNEKLDKYENSDK
tara:strand:- start:1206 stop:2588 length:1383 start_codon:yes stop_codon:yes gene_type:complete